MFVDDVVVHNENDRCLGLFFSDKFQIYKTGQLTPGAMLAAMKFLLPMLAVEQNPTRSTLLDIGEQ